MRLLAICHGKPLIKMFAAGNFLNCVSRLIYSVTLGATFFPDLLLINLYVLNSSAKDLRNQNIAKGDQWHAKVTTEIIGKCY